MIVWVRISNDLGWGPVDHRAVRPWNL